MTTQDLDITTADLAAQESLRLLGLDGNNWIAPRGDVDHDVAIIGAGQSGITTAHALLRAGVANVTVIDSGRQDADLAWQSRARMRTLRTAKSISGPELGNPALSFAPGTKATAAQMLSMTSIGSRHRIGQTT